MLPVLKKTDTEIVIYIFSLNPLWASRLFFCVVISMPVSMGAAKKEWDAQGEHFKRTQAPRENNGPQ